ncbi:MAG: hypothetical protein IJC97_01765 [Oscillospiraceae bacterium]|nr:hypothetical protein [Oscillospiraceae bacterium]
MNKKICTLLSSVVLSVQSLTNLGVLAAPPKLNPGTPTQSGKDKGSSSSSPSATSSRPKPDPKHLVSPLSQRLADPTPSQTSSPIALRKSSRMHTDSPAPNSSTDNANKKLELLSTKRNLLLSFKKLNIKIQAALKKLQPISTSLDSATDKDVVSQLSEKLDSCDKITAMFESNFKRILQSFIQVEQALHALESDSTGGATTTDFSTLSPEYKQWQETISGLKVKCAAKLQQIIASEEEAAREAEEKEREEEQKKVDPTDSKNLTAQIDQIVNELNSIFDTSGNFIESLTPSIPLAEQSEAIDGQLAQVEEQIDHIVQLKTLIQKNREKISVQTVDIEDPQLKSAIVNVINQNKKAGEPRKQLTDDITVSEICTITELDLSAKTAGTISSLNGLQFSLDLQKLDLEGQDQLPPTAVVTISLLDLRELSISGTNLTKAQVGVIVATQDSLDSLHSDITMDFARHDGKKVSSVKKIDKGSSGDDGFGDDDF